MKCLLFAVLLTLSSTAQALFVTDYFHDTDTDLDWLHGSFTAGKNYYEAGQGFGSYLDGGWRYASEAQVTDLFDKVFKNFVPNTPFNSSSTSPFYGPAYPGHVPDLAMFQSLFGSVPDPFDGIDQYTYGLVGDDDIRNLRGNQESLLKLIGGYRDSVTGISEIYGPQRPPQIPAGNSQPIFFTYAVRDHCDSPCDRTLAVPEPGLLGLLGLGLLITFTATKMRA